MDQHIHTRAKMQRWDSDLARFSSPDYHVNNLCSPVLFQEAQEMYPGQRHHNRDRSPPSHSKEISLSSNCFHTANEKRRHQPSRVCLTQLGRLYVEGANIDTIKLFIPAAFERKVYPVPYNTRFLSPLVKSECVTFLNTKISSRELKVRTVSQNNTFKYTIDAAIM
jgi:fatty acid synthase, animal type